MSDLSKRHPQRDFADGFRAYKRGEPRDGTTAAWLEGWDAAAAVAERDALRAKLVTARILLRRVNTEFREVLHTSDRDTPTWRDAWDLIDSIDAALNGDGDGS